MEEEETEAIMVTLNEELTEDTTSVQEILEKPYILVFPNPTSDELRVQVKTTRLQKIDLTIQNAQGQIMHFGEENLMSEMTQSSINVSDYPPGMYWLRIRFVEDGDWQVIQFVKVN
jgi:hypothetical protein